MRSGLLKVIFWLWQMGSGMHDVRVLDASGSQPPKQNSWVNVSRTVSKTNARDVQGRYRKSRRNLRATSMTEMGCIFKTK